MSRSGGIDGTENAIAKGIEEVTVRAHEITTGVDTRIARSRQTDGTEMAAEVAEAAVATTGEAAEGVTMIEIGAGETTTRVETIATGSATKMNATPEVQHHALH